MCTVDTAITSEHNGVNNVLSTSILVYKEHTLYTDYWN